mgnify:CR=1 FL=1
MKKEKKFPGNYVPKVQVGFRNIPKELWLYYKAYCSRRGVSLKDDFIQHIQESIKKDRQKRKISEIIEEADI